MGVVAGTRFAGDSARIAAGVAVRALQGCCVGVWDISRCS